LTTTGILPDAVAPKAVLANADCRPLGVTYFLMNSARELNVFFVGEKKLIVENPYDSHTPTQGACSSFTGMGTWEVKQWSSPRNGGISGSILCYWDHAPEPNQNLTWTTRQALIVTEIYGDQPRGAMPIYPRIWNAALPVN
jgi:hypothetical protein